MRVTCEELGTHGCGPDAIVVRLDDGTGVWAFCIADDPALERAEFEEMLRRVIDEDRRLRPKARARRTPAPQGPAPGEEPGT